MFKSENFLLTFLQAPQKPPLLWWEGMKGRGNGNFLPSPIKEESNILWF
jgi:hypothetical protein